MLFCKRETQKHYCHAVLGAVHLTRLSVPFVVLCRVLVCDVIKQDRDAVIAAVEDARAAQEREAERLRDKLSGFGKTLTPLTARTNGTASTAATNGGTLRDFSGGNEGGRDDLVDSAEVGFSCTASALSSARCRQ